MHNNTAQDIMEVLGVMPNLTLQEIRDLIPHASYVSIQTTVSKLKRQGKLVVSGQKPITTGTGPRNASAYSINTDPNHIPAPKKRKLTQPTEAGLAAQVEQLKGQIAELEAWKQAAMSRFPDLAVSPIVLKARKLVADEVRAGGDTLLANQIIEGKKDDTLLVKVTIKALEEAMDG